MDITPLTFTHDGKERKCRRINKTDHDCFKQMILMERLQAAQAGRASAEAQGIALARPVSAEERIDYMCSPDGRAYLLTRCVQHFDQTFTLQEAEQMVAEGDAFIADNGPFLAGRNGGFYFPVKPRESSEGSSLKEG